MLPVSLLPVPCFMELWVAGYIWAISIPVMMTRAQVTLVNAPYVLMSAFLIWACREMALRAAIFEDTATRCRQAFSVSCMLKVT